MPTNQAPAGTQREKVDHWHRLRQQQRLDAAKSEYYKAGTPADASSPIPLLETLSTSPTNRFPTTIHQPTIPRSNNPGVPNLQPFFGSTLQRHMMDVREHQQLPAGANGMSALISMPPTSASLLNGAICSPLDVEQRSMFQPLPGAQIKRGIQASSSQIPYGIQSRMAPCPHSYAAVMEPGSGWAHAGILNTCTAPFVAMKLPLVRDYSSPCSSSMTSVRACWSPEEDDVMRPSQGGLAQQP
eukprot:scaffold146894_cov35-Tisochrysis_lutea.AAC.1